MKKLLMIGVLALTMGQASAQRCLPKMQGIEINVACVDGKPLSAAFCGGAALSTYTKNGSKWVFGGEYLQRNYAYDEDMTIPVAQFTAEGGYYKKLLTDAFGDKINQWLIIAKVSCTSQSLLENESCEGIKGSRFIKWEYMKF